MEKVLYQFHFDFRNFIICFIPLIVGLGFFFAWKWYRIQNPGCEVKGNSDHNVYVVTKIIGWIVGTFCLLLFAISIFGYISSYNDIKSIIASNTLHEVEGSVENYHPMPKEGHDSEHFYIKGVYFEYSDFYIRHGYQNAASLGGVITHNGQNLKIKYYENSQNENVIVYIAERR